jgi:hypothetical protein
MPAMVGLSCAIIILPISHDVLSVLNEPILKEKVMVINILKHDEAVAPKAKAIVNLLLSLPRKSTGLKSKNKS